MSVVFGFRMREQLCVLGGVPRDLPRDELRSRLRGAGEESLGPALQVADAQRVWFNFVQRPDPTNGRRWAGVVSSDDVG